MALHEALLRALEFLVLVLGLLQVGLRGTQLQHQLVLSLVEVAHFVAQVALLAQHGTELLPGPRLLLVQSLQQGIHAGDPVPRRGRTGFPLGELSAARANLVLEDGVHLGVQQQMSRGGWPAELFWLGEHHHTVHDDAAHAAARGAVPVVFDHVHQLPTLHVFVSRFCCGR